MGGKEWGGQTRQSDDFFCVCEFARLLSKKIVIFFGPFFWKKNREFFYYPNVLPSQPYTHCYCCCCHLILHPLPFLYFPLHTLCSAKWKNSIFSFFSRFFYEKKKNCEGGLAGERVVREYGEEDTSVRDDRKWRKMKKGEKNGVHGFLHFSSFF